MLCLFIGMLYCAIQAKLEAEEVKSEQLCLPSTKDCACLSCLSCPEAPQHPNNSQSDCVACLRAHVCMFVCGRDREIKQGSQS